MEKQLTVMLELNARDLQIIKLALDNDNKTIKRYAKKEAAASSFLNSNCYGELLNYQEKLTARVAEQQKLIPPHIPKEADADN